MGPDWGKRLEAHLKLLKRNKVKPCECYAFFDGKGATHVMFPIDGSEKPALFARVDFETPKKKRGK